MEIDVATAAAAADDDALTRRKLCGFLRAVLGISSPTSTQTQILAPGCPCSFSGGAASFLCDGGLSLVPLPVAAAGANEPEPSSSSSSPAGKARRGRRKGVAAAGGGGGGGASVVHQLRALVAGKCVEVEARVLRVVAASQGDGCGHGDGVVEKRAVVLVDVYLPIAAWSGWQFPRLRATAVALFKHVSCNWDVRNALLACDWSAQDRPHCDDKYIWSCSDCHVLGCEIHQTSSASINQKLYDLHEIFKSLPGVETGRRMHFTRIIPDKTPLALGIWDITDDVLNKVLLHLRPKDLVRVAATCRHLRTLAASIMPCMKLKLFPHQEAAVEWMIKRERNSEVLAHPLYKDFCTEDGFSFYINFVSGELSTGDAPTISDFRGGMFCDEPGLGKTVTALSLILKTNGTLADPPHGVDVRWCMHRPDEKCGYYELSAGNSSNANFVSTWKRLMGKDMQQGKLCSNESLLALSSVESPRSSRKRGRSVNPDFSTKSLASSNEKPMTSSLSATHVLRCTRNSDNVRRNLMDAFGRDSCGNKRKRENEIGSTRLLAAAEYRQPANPSNHLRNSDNKSSRKNGSTLLDSSEIWVQCDACRKWRKLSDGSIPDTMTAWFCSMNSDPLHQNCFAPEESWDIKTKITHLPGFYTKGTSQGKEQNVSFFTNVLKEHFTSFNSETKKALMWLAKLSPKKLLELETVGLTRPVLDARTVSGKDAHGYYKIFQAFGLVRKVERGITRWYYPPMLDNLAFDSSAFRIALTKPLDLLRFYLSRATLIVVPANLVDHWKTQIERHVAPGQLRVYVWGDHKRPSAHNLAWDYDIVITTFSRLSAEWGPRKRSVLMQIHWLRIMLDEGHTLGSSLTLTNKLQMAVSLAASCRWILTGTPTPNTPTSQVAHLYPMLKFLHEEAYGQNHQPWDAGIHRPFEAQAEEGRFRLVQLLQRTMISARKADLKNIPPCIRKITFLHFNDEHARSYNELVATVRRNILLADWNDPSHVESLLNPKQWKFRSSTIKNVRLSCCVAGHIKVTDAGQDIQETMDVLVQQGLDPLSEECAFIRFSLLNGCSCFRCEDWCRLPVVTPCRHLLCLGCVALDSEKCTLPGCGNHYEMQSPELIARAENPNPKWPVPKDLIELQPSYKQDDWDPDWQSTSSSKVAYLVEKLKSLQERDTKPGHDIDLISECSGKDIDTKIDGQFYGTMPEKVIIFSQFLEHIHVIQQQLTIAGITYAGMYSPMHSGNKMKSLMIFQQDPNCTALLMDGSAALGLDLSFVTHVFLMEPIWDRSMEEQVISRAHRMGATRPIYVETLAMRGTIEEQMVELLQDSSACRRMVRKEIGSSDHEVARPHRTLHDFAESNYLAQLSFVHRRVNT